MSSPSILLLGKWGSESLCGFPKLTQQIQGWDSDSCPDTPPRACRQTHWPHLRVKQGQDCPHPGQAGQRPSRGGRGSKARTAAFRLVSFLLLPVMLFSLDWKKSGRKGAYLFSWGSKKWLHCFWHCNTHPFETVANRAICVNMLSFPSLEQPGKVDILSPIFLQEETESQWE